MPDWGDLLFWPVYLYLLASLASLLALGTRWGKRAPVGAAEATLRAVFPAAVLLLTPLAAILGLEPACRGSAAHAIWHHWENHLLESSQGHTALHLGNVLLFGVLMACAARTGLWFWRVHRFASAVAAHATRAGGNDACLYRLNTSRPICFTAGWLRPKVYLSTRLEDELDPLELDAVLAHEQEHASRRDPLVGGLLTAFFTLFPVPGSALLLQEWRAAAERACDAAAAKTVGSHLTVAKTLMRVVNCAQGNNLIMHGTTGFTGEDIFEQRIDALLHPGEDKPNRLPVFFGVCGVFLLVSTPIIQHLAALVVHD